MKKIVIITLAVALEGEKGYTRFRSLAEILSQWYEVDLITSTFQHWEKKQRSYAQEQSIGLPYNVQLAFEPGYKKNVDIRRVISHRIVVKNILNLLKKKPYDLIYCIIPDNRVAAKVGEYAKKNKINYIVDIEDLWPEAMEMVSPFPTCINHILFKSYRKNALVAYKSADAFVGTSDEYRDVPANLYGICGKPSHTVYVGCELSEFDKGVKEYFVSIEKNQGEWWVTYAGNLGSSYDISTLIKTAQELYKDGFLQIHIKILGSGPLENHFKYIANQKSCNVEFVGYTPYRKMAAFLTKSDVLINSFVKKAPQSIVTKIGDYLSAGKPIINTLSSEEFRKKVESDGFGVNVEAENIVALKESILSLYNNPDLCHIMGEKSRQVAEEQFDRKKSYMIIKEMIDKLINR